MVGYMKHIAKLLCLRSAQLTPQPMERALWQGRSVARDHERQDPHDSEHSPTHEQSRLTQQSWGPVSQL
jgi:hypothetical protein